MKRVLGGTLLLLIAITFSILGFSQPKVAVIDTGVDPARLPAPLAGRVKKNLDLGLNLLAPEAGVLDQDGHGTRVIQSLLEACSRCEVIVIKISEHGAGVRASDLVQALEHAWSKGARVVNLSAGLASGSPELELKVKELSKKGLILVTATGHGIKNPFRPMPLKEVFPQAYHPAVLVVGAQSGPESQNYGPELDIALEGAGLTPSHAAARLSGRIAQSLRWVPGVGVHFVRAVLAAF